MKRLVMIVLLGAVTACGSTVPLATQQQALSAGSGLGDGLGADGLPTTGPTAVAGSTQGPPTTTNGERPTGAATALAGTTKAAVPVSTARPTTPIRVGVLFLKGADKTASALGISGLSTGDTQAQAKAVFDWASTHGGFGGRKTQVSYYGIDSSESASNPEAAQQQACTALVQDNHVQFVVSILQLYTATMACFAKAGVGVIDDASGLTAAKMKAYEQVFTAPGDFSADRLMKELIDGLWRRGWLNAKSKVGLFTYDTPDHEGLMKGPVTAYLKAHGLTPVAVERGSNSASGVNDAGAAVLKFKTLGVDRIIPILASPLFLMISASTQGYRPAYAMYSLFGPGALIESAAPKDQLTNSAGIGYSPYLDIGAGTHPGPVNANETLCFAVFKAAGQQSTSATTKGIQLQVCSAILFLKAMADKVPSAPKNLFTLARPLIGASFPPPDTFRSDTSRHPDGAAGYRDLLYQSSCSCYQYVSGVHATS